MTTRVFITGMARSGTTLLDKLLASHPDATILSQPFPLLFVGAKSAFLKVRAALPKIYPLNSLFLETDYTYEDFSHFLSRFDFSRAELVNLFGEMKSYQGQYTKTPDIDSAIAEFRSYRFAELFAQLQYHFRRRSAPTVCGSKETYCEEFVPFLVQSGWKCIIMVRDPRDTVVSLNYGHFERFLGKRSDNKE